MPLFDRSLPWGCKRSSSPFRLNFQGRFPRARQSAGSRSWGLIWVSGNNPGAANVTNGKPITSAASRAQSDGGKNISWVIGITNIFAVTRAKAAARSPPVSRDTSPRCHFHAIRSRLLGSIDPKYPHMKASTKWSMSVKLSALWRPCWKNSVDQPITVQSIA